MDGDVACRCGGDFLQGEALQDGVTETGGEIGAVDELVGAVERLSRVSHGDDGDGFRGGVGLDLLEQGYRIRHAGIEDDEVRGAAFGGVDDLGNQGDNRAKEPRMLDCSDNGFGKGWAVRADEDFFEAAGGANLAGDILQGRDALGEKLASAEGQRVLDIVGGSAVGKDENRDAVHNGVGTETGEDLEAVHVGHHDVEEDHIRVNFRGALETLATIVGDGDIEALAAEFFVEDPLQMLIVLDQQEIHLAPFTSNRSATFSRTLWTLNSPLLMKA